MMKYMFKIAFSCMCFAMVSQSWAILNVLDTFQPGNGSRYHLIAGSNDGMTGLTWSEAEACAIGLGGHLTTINNEYEQNVIWNRWGDHGFGIRDQKRGWASLWIGLTDEAVEGVFEWISGEPVTYLNWGPGEPNKLLGNEDYAFMSGTLFLGGEANRGKWNDYLDLPTHSTSQEVLYGVVEITNIPDASATWILMLPALACLHFFKRLHMTSLKRL